MKSIKNLMMLAICTLTAWALSKLKLPGFQNRNDPMERLLYISRCNDGDTCLAHNPQRISYKLRLLGIDAPEMASPKGAGQTWAKEAKTRLNDLVSGKQHKVQFYGGDIYGRHLVIVYPVGQSKSINESMLEEGHVFAYQEKYMAIEKKAQLGKMGFWKLQSPPENPSNWRLKTKVRRTSPSGYEHL